MLENYCLARQIKKQDWQQKDDWVYEKYQGLGRGYVKTDDDLAVEDLLNTLKKQISSLLTSFEKKLKKAKISDILQKILYNMYAEKISDIEEENFLSVNAYSKLLKENNLKYLDREINLNIGIRYSEDDDKTMIYIATPIIKIDY